MNDAAKGQAEDEVPAPKKPWSDPKLTDFGAVAEVTEGISYLPLDGLFNQSP